MENKIREELYSKMEKELNEYKDELRNKTPDEVIKNAYELAIKEEMICSFYPESLTYDIKDIKLLNKKSHPLQELFNEWMDSDININELLDDTIYEYFSLLKDEQSKKKNSLER